MGCPFCDRPHDLLDRVFYEAADLGWFAFLSAPPHTKGHTILAAKKRKNGCPRDFDLRTLRSLDVALDAVARTLQQCYPAINDLLFCFLRGDVRHFHVHLVPLWPDEEQEWRRVTGYPRSHLMEYLGALEQRHDFLVLHRSAREHKSEEAQRLESTESLAGEIEALRRVTGYCV